MRISRIVVLTLALSVPAAVSAQPTCPPTDIGPLEVTPADSAQLVTRDAYVAVLYSPGYFSPGNGSPEESIELATAAGVAVPGTTQQIGDQLFFVPDALLAPSTRYLGVATGSSGDFEFVFTTGTIADAAPPSIVEGTADPLLEVRSAEVEPSCEAEDGGVRVGVTVTRAVDDGPAGSVEYHLYLTRAPNLEAPRLVARERNFTSADTMTLAFVLPLEEAGVYACVSLVVSDGVGRTSRWQEPVCFDPTEEARFLGLCTQSVAGSAARGGRAAWLGLALVALSVVARRVATRRARAPRIR